MRLTLFKSRREKEKSSFSENQSSKKLSKAGSYAGFDREFEAFVFSMHDANGNPHSFELTGHTAYIFDANRTNASGSGNWFFLATEEASYFVLKFSIEESSGVWNVIQVTKETAEHLMSSSAADWDRLFYDKSIVRFIADTNQAARHILPEKCRLGRITNAQATGSLLPSISCCLHVRKIQKDNIPTVKKDRIAYYYIPIDHYSGQFLYFDLGEDGFVYLNEHYGNAANVFHFCGHYQLSFDAYKEITDYLDFQPSSFCSKL